MNQVEKVEAAIDHLRAVNDNRLTDIHDDLHQELFDIKEGVAQLRADINQGITTLTTIIVIMYCHHAGWASELWTDLFGWLS